MQVTVELIAGAITWVSPSVRRVLNEIIAAKGLVPEADALASSAGFRDRHDLKRRLRREGLPSLRALSRYIRVLLWVEEWERTGVALSRSALHSAADPAVRFRCVKEITGSTWSEVRTLGTTWILLRLLQRCRKPAQGEADGEEAASDPNTQPPPTVATIGGGSHARAPG